MASTVDMRSGFRTMGVLRPETQPSEEPVALEMTVVVTGARPGNVGAKRELFTEETQTVLVFEKGAVIRLSAGVADGQLLFLTNKKTSKEVVTQVIRKRSFRPTSCYVDLAFTEPSPGFWGIEFPKSAPVVPSQVASDSGGDEPTDAAKHAAPPDLQEVARLKREVAELQTQLKSLIGSSASEAAAEPPAAGTNGSNGDAAIGEPEEKMLAQLLAQEAQQEQLYVPQRLVGYSKKDTGSVVKAVSKVATAAAIGAVVVAAAIAAYRFGLFDYFLTRSAVRKPTPSHASANANSFAQPTAKPGGATPAAAPSTAISPATSALSLENPGKTEITSVSLPATVDSKRPEDVPVSGARHSTPLEAKRGNSRATSTFAGAAGSGTRSDSSSNSSMTSAEDSNAATEDYREPKLIYSVKPVSPSEALRNYVTGNVYVDALVDTTGHVQSVTVISGPQKLRNQAIAEIKQYVYQPARKNGKPVASHVQTSLKYWYEP